MTGIAQDQKPTTNGVITNVVEHILSGKPWKATPRDMFFVSIGLTLKEHAPSFSLSLPERVGILNSDGLLVAEPQDSYYLTLSENLTAST
jgi:hypothetical protein